MNVKQVINQEHKAANKRLIMQKKKHEKAEMCMREKYWLLLIEYR